jgi:hypothetical protein
MSESALEKFKREARERKVERKVEVFFKKIDRKGKSKTC